MRKIIKKKGIDSNKSKESEIYYKKLNDLKNKSQKFNLKNVYETLLFASRRTVTRILYYDHIYKLILNKPGVILEFGVLYGHTLSLLGKFRGIYEPYNSARKIVGFDTVSGFANKFNKDEKKWK